MKKTIRTLAISQGIPLVLTVVIFFILTVLYYGQISLLNRFTHDDIVLQIRWEDVLIGMTIYLKTSVDFAIFIGNLMSTAKGWKNRIAIEVGTAMGNGLGTMIILSVWDFFRAVKMLLAIMVFIASLVLFKLAEEGLEHAEEGNDHAFINRLAKRIGKPLHWFNTKTGIVLNYIMPNLSMKAPKNVTWVALLGTSFMVPFILGLDDFAGYVPLFDIVNVFGFGIGVFLGHMLLNIFLFISPTRTIKLVKHPIISFAGSIAFIILGIWGMIEVFKIFIHHV